MTYAVFDIQGQVRCIEIKGGEETREQCRKVEMSQRWIYKKNGNRGLKSLGIDLSSCCKENQKEPSESH
ncbi:hypothetical protein K443DRAFT_671934 [Laccaria amethystina LaAM-08-1]|jgi:hypothetical protein|uniref:Uncharacterized protein n=1 Tax=Laccaria amethystina LaAM-08-1 TaxID=1095629 RepID=A0A0C9YEJ9_9AGAR|nr:hypothetical protein K443DRAFT_671934 [Laccaria amethystina LaAM-08-1]